MAVTIDTTTCEAVKERMAKDAIRKAKVWSSQTSHITTTGSKKGMNSLMARATNNRKKAQDRKPRLSNQANKVNEISWNELADKLNQIQNKL